MEDLNLHTAKMDLVSKALVKHKKRKDVLMSLGISHPTLKRWEKDFLKINKNENKTRGQKVDSIAN